MVSSRLFLGASNVGECLEGRFARPGSSPTPWRTGLAALCCSFLLPPASFADEVKAPLAPGVVINEIYYHPPETRRGDRANEWIELHNPTAAERGLGGWRLSGGVRFTFPPSATLAPTGMLVIAEDPEEFARAHEGFTGSVLGPFEGRLDNAGESVELRDARGAIVDRVAYDDEPPWPTLADGLGHSLERINPTSQGERAGSWRASRAVGGSPGGGNSFYEPLPEGQEPPWVEGLTIEGGSAGEHGLRAGEPFRVVARVHAASGIKRARLLEQVVPPGAYIARGDRELEESWSSRPLESAGDGRLSARVGPFPHRTLVRFRVEIEDRLGRRTLYPDPREPVPNVAAFVWDGDSASLKSPLPVYFLITKERWVGEMGSFPKRPYWSAYPWRGTVVSGGRVFDHVEFRLRGGDTRYKYPKRNLKIRFQRGHLFRGGGGFLGSYPRRHLNLSAAAERFGLDEALAYRLFREADLLAPDTAFVNLQVIHTAEPSADEFGLALDVEEIGGRFFKARGIAMGELYKLDGTPVLRNRARGVPSGLGDLLRVVQEGATTEWLRAHLDLGRYFAFGTVCALTETFDLGNRNYYLFRDRETLRWQLIPSDLNGSFGLKSVTARDWFTGPVGASFRGERHRVAEKLAETVFAETEVDRVLAELTAGVEGIAEVDFDRWWKSARRPKLVPPGAHARYLARRIRRNVSRLEEWISTLRDEEGNDVGDR